MESSLRNTPALIARIEKLRDDLIQRYETIVALARPQKQDRNTTAVMQYQIQSQTASLIRAAEEVQTLIRQLQEMWLFGQLSTLGASEARQQTDDTAIQVLELLQRLSMPATGIEKDQDVKSETIGLAAIEEA